jgi:hypothetical protein
VRQFGHSASCWKLHKAVNGLKQSGHAYYMGVRRDMEKHGCRCLSVDICVFMRICASPQGVASRCMHRTGHTRAR